MSRFINNLKRRVSKEQKKIVLPESESRRILQAAERVQAEGFARPILIGRPQNIVEVASEYQIDMDGIEIIDPETYPMLDTFCQYYAKLRLIGNHDKGTADRRQARMRTDDLESRTNDFR